MNFEVTLDDFNGPLDLMLYLIKEKKLDLFDLNIVELADQYIAFLDKFQDEKLEIASEYLSELAGLIEFKSKRLLPKDRSELDAKEVEDEVDLVRRLIEYQRYKEVSIDLANRFEERLRQFDKPISTHLIKDIKQKLNDSITYEQTPFDLMAAMEKVMTRYQLAHPMDVSLETKELAVDDVIDDLRKMFEIDKTYTLDDILMNTPTIQHLLVNFLAILDMLRMQEINMSIQKDVVYLKGA